MTRLTKFVERSIRATEDAAGAGDRQLAVLKKLRIVIRAAQRHSTWIEKRCGLNGAQLWIMQELYEAPGLRVGEIADKLAIHQTTASNLLRPLERRGYLVKERDAQDKRVVKLVLSEQGMALLAQAPKPARGLLPEALRQSDAAELASLDAGLEGLLNSMCVVDEAYGLEPLPFNM
ncbi:MAG: MarR family transcriptional regulator [Noviherbaspirillum sp.]|nr:MarR family transcriptional regulator [Noviherbaspirillum sp.]